MLQRDKRNPILRPIGSHSWESLKVYNPGVIYRNGVYHMWYNTVGNDWINRIGYARSSDGIIFDRLNSPEIIPSDPFDKKGLMDPRVTVVNEVYYMTYSADDGSMRRLALATSSDLKKWVKHGPMLRNWDAIRAGAFRIVNGVRLPEKPERKERSKAGGIFSEVIGDKYWMIFGNSYLWLASSEDGIGWEVDYLPILKPREGNYFDSLSVQSGPPPIKTEYGWLVFYHGRNLGKGDYRLGYFLLDLHNPRKILFRSENPVFEPKESYEISGIVDILEGGFTKMKAMSRKELDSFILQSTNNNLMPGVIFCCGAVLVNGIVRIYYGAGDTVIGTASAELKDILGK